MAWSGRTKKRDEFGNLVDTAQAKAALIRGTGTPLPAAEADDPGWFQRLLGPVNTVGGFTAALQHNYLKAESDKLNNTGDLIRTDLENLIPGAIPYKFISAQLAPDAANPFEQAGRAFQGRQYAGITEAAREHFAPASERMFGADSAVTKINENPVFQAGVGIVGEGLSDPTSYGTLGLSAGTKVAKAERIAAMADDVVDAATLAKHGLDAAKLVADNAGDWAKVAGKGPDLATALGQGIRVKDLPPKIAQALDSAVGLEVGAQQAGRVSKAYVPFVRKATETGGTAGLKATLPWMRKVGPEEVAAHIAAGDKTLFAKSAAKTGVAPTIRSFGATGERVGVSLGTKVADRGGIKLAGQTILDVQPQMDKATRAIQAGLRSTKAGRAVESGFSRVAPMALRGNPFVTAAAKADDRTFLQLARTAAKNAAIEDAMPAMHSLDDAQRTKATLAAEELWRNPEDKAELIRLNADEAELGKKADQIVRGELKPPELSLQPGTSPQTWGKGQERIVGKESAFPIGAERAAKPGIPPISASKPSWESGIREQLQTQADQELFLTQMGGKQTAKNAAGGDFIDAFKEATGGRMVSDQSRLDAQDMMRLDSGQKVPIREEVARYRDAGIPVASPSSRMGVKATNEEDIIVRLKDLHPGEYDHIQTSDELWQAVDAARVNREKTRYVKGLAGARTEKATTESVYRMGLEQPDMIEGAFQRNLEAANVKGDEAAFDRVSEQYARWQEWHAWADEQTGKTVAGGVPTTNAGQQADIFGSSTPVEISGPAKIQRPAPATAPQGALFDKTVLPEQAGQQAIPVDVPAPAAQAIPMGAGAALASPTPRTARQVINDRRAAIFEKADYSNARQALLDHGSSPEEADLITSYLQDDLLPRMDAVQRAERAQGLGGKSLFGQGSTGYVYHTEPPRPSTFEDMSNRLGYRTPEQQSRDAILTDWGYDPLSLTVKERTPQGLRTSTKAKQPQSRQYPFLSQRLEAGVDTQLDVAKATAVREMKSGTNIATAKFEEAQIGRYGTELGEGEDALEGEIVRTLTRNGETMRYSIPEDVDRWTNSIDKIFTDDEAANFFLRGFDRVQNSFKRWATARNPGFHVRNAISNYFLGWSVDRAQPKGWIDAIDIAGAAGTRRGGQKFTFGGVTQTADDWWAQGAIDGVRRETFGPQEVASVVQREVGRRGAQQSLKEGNILKGMKALPDIGTDVGTAVEDTSRMAVYFNSLDAGMTRGSSASLADVALYNYQASALTGFQKSVVKRAVPFGTWMMQNLPHMASFVAHNPGKAAIFEKVRNAFFAASDVDPSMLADYQKEMGAMPIPGLTQDVLHTATLGALGNEGNNDPILLNPNIPLQDLGRMKPSGNLAQGFGVVPWLGGQVSPLAKAAVEGWTGVDTFTGNKIEQYPGQKTPLLGGALDWAAPALSKLPWMATQYDRTTGEPYLAAPAAATKTLTTFNPFLNNLGKAAGGLGDPNNAFSWASWIGGIKMMPANERDMAISQMAGRSAELAAEIQRLKDAGILPADATATQARTGW